VYPALLQSELYTYPAHLEPLPKTRSQNEKNKIPWMRNLLIFNNQRRVPTSTHPFCSGKTQCAAARILRTHKPPSVFASIWGQE
jgi:hypothetical protein